MENSKLLVRTIKQTINNSYTLNAFTVMGKKGRLTIFHLTRERPKKDINKTIKANSFLKYLVLLK